MPKQEDDKSLLTSYIWKLNKISSLSNMKNDEKSYKRSYSNSFNISCLIILVKK